VGQEQGEGSLCLNAGFVVCKFNIMIHLLRGIMQSLIFFFIFDLASNNLVECILAPPRVGKNIVGCHNFNGLKSFSKSF